MTIAPHAANSMAVMTVMTWVVGWALAIAEGGGGGAAAAAAAAAAELRC